MFVSDEGSTPKTLDFAFYMGGTPTFYISINKYEHGRLNI